MCEKNFKFTLHDHTQEIYLHQIFDKLTTVRKCRDANLTFHSMVCLASSTSTSVPPGWPYQRACHILSGKIQCGLLLCLCPAPRTMPGSCIPATRKGLSAAPVPLPLWRGRANAPAEQHYPGADPWYLQANNTDPQTPSRKGIPVWHCLFLQSPSKAAPQDCPALLCLWGAPDKMCQNLSKHVLSYRKHQWLKAVYRDAPKVIRKGEKKKKRLSPAPISTLVSHYYRQHFGLKAHRHSPEL